VLCGVWWGLSGGIQRGQGVWQDKDQPGQPHTPCKIKVFRPGKPKFYRQIALTPVRAITSDPSRRHCYTGGGTYRAHAMTSYTGCCEVGWMAEGTVVHGGHRVSGTSKKRRISGGSVGVVDALLTCRTRLFFPCREARVRASHGTSAVHFSLQTLVENTPMMQAIMAHFGHLSRDGKSSEQFVWRTLAYR
jgi:hypothetical protein